MQSLSPISTHLQIRGVNSYPFHARLLLRMYFCLFRHSTHHVESPTLTHKKTTMSSIEIFDNQSDDRLSIGEQLSQARRASHDGKE